MNTAMAAPEAQLGAEAGLVEAVIAALDGDSVDACLEAAVRALRSRGLAEADGAGEVWLDVQRGDTRFRLTAAQGVEPPGPRERALLRHAFGMALARVAERDEARKVIERLELLRTASF